MRQYLYFFVCVIIISCNNPKKLHRMMDDLPEATAKECADRFPIKETIETITVEDTALLQQYAIEFNYMAGLIDSLLSANCDTIHIEKIRNVIKKIPCKPVTKVIIKTQENTAKQQVILDSCQRMSSLLNKKLDTCDKKVNELVAKCDKYKRQRNNYLWIIICLLVWIFRRPILRFLKFV